MNNKFLIFLIGVFFISFANAQPPVQTTLNSNSGLDIYYLPFEYLKVNTAYDFSLHVANKSDGYIFNNSVVNCSIHIYNQTGEHVAISNFTKSADNIDHLITINASIISNIGAYGWRVLCDGPGTLDASIEGAWETTVDGFPFDLPKAGLSVFVIIFLTFLSMSTVYVANNKLPQGDNSTEEGTIISVNFLKYLRPILWSFSWIMVVGIIFLLFNLSEVYLYNNMLSTFLFVMYKIFFWFTIIGFPVYFIWLIAKFFQDREMQQMIERGVDIKSEYG